MKLSKEIVAYHEAGHATVARLLSVEVGEATIVRAGDLPGYVRHKPADPEREAMILIAGATAARKQLSASSDQLDGYIEALEDFDRAMKLIGTLVPDGNEQVVDEWLQRLDRRVAQMIGDHWEAVERVAVGLLERETLSGAEVDGLIRGVPPASANTIRGSE